MTRTVSGRAMIVASIEPFGRAAQDRGSSFGKADYFGAAARHILGIEPRVIVANRARLDRRRESAGHQQYRLRHWLHQPSTKPGRAALVPVGRLLIGPADAQGGRLVIAAADDLQRQRQPARGKAVRQCQRAQLQHVDEAGEMRRGRSLVDRLDAESRRSASSASTTRRHRRAPPRIRALACVALGAARAR